MKFRSTLRRGSEVSLRDAVLRGSAPDGGLYMPVEMPRLSSDFPARVRSLSFPELAREVGALFLGDGIGLASRDACDCTNAVGAEIPELSCGHRTEPSGQGDRRAG